MPLQVSGLRRTLLGLTSHLAESIDHYSSNDVQFLFPDPPHSPRCLWANSTTLKKHSSYFTSILDGGFSESQGGFAPHLIPCTVPSSDNERQFREDDSDDDTSHPQKTPPRAQPILIKTLVIKDCPYTTYRALLCYLSTGHISFARLRSNVLVGAAPIFPRLSSTNVVNNPSHTPPHRRGSKLPVKTPPGPFKDAWPTDRPTAPTDKPEPVSPKSIYLIADQLMIPSLQALALASFHIQLSARNVLFELLSSTVECYPELRLAALDVAVAKWPEVSQGLVWKYCRERAAEGDLSASQTAALLEVATRLGVEAARQIKR